MESNNKTPLLEVEDLQMYFTSEKGVFQKTKTVVRAVDGVSFTIGRGETFGLVGESGCGKTTTGKCILRINKPTAGKILYKGLDLATADESQVKPHRRELQLIFQDPYSSLDPRQSIFSILKEAIVTDGKPHTDAEVTSKVGELLTTVELDPSMARRFPHEMSGGQRQRLGIARALACNPELIVCDEPVSALDVSIQAQIINLFSSIQKQLGIAYLFVAHDLAVVRHISHTIGVMYLGHLVEVTDAGELYQNPVHPYTRALLSAIPVTNYDEEQQRRRVVLQGEVPSPMHVPTGCPFHPRCQLATELCRKERPALHSVGERHQVACHLA